MDIHSETPTKLSAYQRYKSTIDGWKKANRSRHNEHNAAYRAKNREKLRLYQAEYRKKKKEKEEAKIEGCV